MICSPCNKKARICIFENCNKRANFNLEGQKNGIYCSTHKLEGMINVLSKTCVFEGCRKQPVFNLEGTNKGIYCTTHKLEGMINV